MHEDDNNNVDDIYLYICYFSTFLLPLAFPLFISAWIFNKMPHIHIVVAYSMWYCSWSLLLWLFRAKTYFATLLLLLLLLQHSCSYFLCVYHHDNGLALHLGAQLMFNLKLKWQVWNFQWTPSFWRCSNFINLTVIKRHTSFCWNKHLLTNFYRKKDGATAAVAYNST